MVIRVQAFTDILEPFCNGPKTEVALINTVQVYCYEDTRIIKAFPQVLKVRSRSYLAFRRAMAYLTLPSAPRFCITRIVSLIKLSSTGTRRGLSRRAGNISSKRPNLSSRWTVFPSSY